MKLDLIEGMSMFCSEEIWATLDLYIRQRVLENFASSLIATNSALLSGRQRKDHQLIAWKRFKKMSTQA